MKKFIKKISVSLLAGVMLLSSSITAFAATEKAPVYELQASYVQVESQQYQEIAPHWQLGMLFSVIHSFPIFTQPNVHSQVVVHAWPGQRVMWMGWTWGADGLMWENVMLVNEAGGLAFSGWVRNDVMQIGTVRW